MNWDFNLIKSDHGRISIENNTTANVVKITMTDKEVVESGNGPLVSKSVYLDWDQFEDLVLAIKPFLDNE